MKEFQQGLDGRTINSIEIAAGSTVRVCTEANVVVVVVEVEVVVVVVVDVVEVEVVVVVVVVVVLIAVVVVVVVVAVVDVIVVVASSPIFTLEKGQCIIEKTILLYIYIYIPE